MDVFSATNSSPWTAYRFGGDEESVEALWRYVRHALILTALTNIGAAWIAGSPMPVIGAAVGSAYMTWLYYDAVQAGAAADNEGWESS